MIKLLYGYGDEQNAIKCDLLNIELTETGAIYTAICEGGKITAPASMFETLYKVNITNADGFNHSIEVYALTPEDAQRKIKIDPFEHFASVQYA